MTLLKNNDCDLVCEGCELETEPWKCIKFIFDDIVKINKENKNKSYNGTQALVEDHDNKFHKRTNNA